MLNEAQEKERDCMDTSVQLIKAQHDHKFDTLNEQIKALEHLLGLGNGWIWSIIQAQRQWMNKRVAETLDKGWKDWSKHVVELQLFHADQENRRKEGHDF